MKKSKELYHIHAFTVCSKRADVLWNRINSLMGRNPKTEEIKEVLHDGNLVSGEAMANVFNDYFVYRDFNDGSPAACRTLGPETTNTFFLAGTIEPEVRTVFLGLKNSRSCDADGMQIKPVKYVIDQISPALTHIFNLCISTGVFPSKMQTARVIALYKKGNKHNVANYRPISILPVFSKGFEKIIFSRLSSFCTKYVLTKRNMASENISLQNSPYWIKKNIFYNSLNKKIKWSEFLWISHKHLTTFTTVFYLKN